MMKQKERGIEDGRRVNIDQEGQGKGNGKGQRAMWNGEEEERDGEGQEKYFSREKKTQELVMKGEGVVHKGMLGRKTE